MPGVFDSTFDIHAQALSLRNQRLQVIANNLANADTPHYKARDLDFDAVMRQQIDANMSMRATHPAHFGSGGLDTGSLQLKYRVPTQPSLDGNTVDTQMEQAAFAENAIRYQTSLTMLNSKIGMLRMAIAGQ